MAVYDIDGNVISGGGSGSSYSPDASPSFYDKICRSINHRGWTSDGAAENSLAAFKASKTTGFYHVETDVRYTSDEKAILYHDDYINGVAVSSMTYAQVLAAVPTIALFDDFIELCRNVCLHPYIEFKGNMTLTQVMELVDVVHLYHMEHQCTWFGSYSNVSKVKNLDESARLGILSHTLTSSNVSDAQSLKLPTNEVFLDTWLANLTSTILDMVKASKLPLEVYTFASGATERNEILGIDPYITGFTANTNIAGKVIYEANIE